MKFLMIVFLCCSSSLASAKALVAYKYLKSKNSVQKSILLKELKEAYTIIKKSTFNPPKPQDFLNDYLRFRLGVEVALHDKKLVKNSTIGQGIVNPYLKQAFHQELYKSFAETKLKARTQKLDKTASALSKNALKRLYAQEPEFNLFFISVYHPIGPTAKQITEANQRAAKIYSQIKTSKTPFLELVALYSDDKSNGVLNINRSRGAIFPEVYNQLKRMKNNSISKPIRVASGYVIVKLNRKVPFNEANRVAIKANYFNKRRSALFNAYFDGLKKDFKITFVNKNLVKTL